MDHVDAVQEVQQDFTASFNEALQTYGVAAAMTALAVFTAGAIHQAEHIYPAAPLLRMAVLGSFLSGVHNYLDALNASCDAGGKPKEPA